MPSEAPATRRIGDSKPGDDPATPPTASATTPGRKAATAPGGSRPFEPRAAGVARLRSFAGRTAAEAAAVLGISARTADDDRAYARARPVAALHDEGGTRPSEGIVRFRRVTRTPLSSGGARHLPVKGGWP